MRKILLISILLGQSLIFSFDNKKTSSEICLCPIPKNTLKLKLNYNRINDTIDVFNIKESELGSNNLGSIGDSSGYDISLGYGLTDFIALYANYNYISINYNDTKLKNSQLDLYTKINLYHNPDNIFKTFSVDIGYIGNSANNLDIKKHSTLNSIVQKIRPGTSIKFSEDGGLTRNGTTLYIIGDNGVLSPFIRLEDLGDKSFYLRALSGIEFQNSVLQIHGGFKKTSIDTLITLKPDHSVIQTALDEFGNINLNRDEKTIFGGLNFAYEYSDYIFEAGYEYLKIFGREKELDATDDNHILNATISKSLTKDLRVFIGGKAMLHQFNGVIPYLYNEYSKHRYDKKYGYAKVGFIYNIDFNSLQYKY